VLVRRIISTRPALVFVDFTLVGLDAFFGTVIVEADEFVIVRLDAARLVNVRSHG